jgi:hypothetical protein
MNEVACGNLSTIFMIYSRDISAPPIGRRPGRFSACPPLNTALRYIWANTNCTQVYTKTECLGKHDPNVDRYELWTGDVNTARISRWMDGWTDKQVGYERLFKNELGQMSQWLAVGSQTGVRLLTGVGFYSLPRSDNRTELASYPWELTHKAAGARIWTSFSIYNALSFTAVPPWSDAYAHWPVYVPRPNKSFWSTWSHASTHKTMDCSWRQQAHGSRYRNEMPIRAHGVRAEISIQVT